jgi:DNA-directed RNA polymerase subunit M/transcription elongation factor TFIIS
MAVAAAEDGGESLRAFVVETIRAHTDLDEDSARDMEIGVFNHSLAKADEKRVAKNWRNPRFRSIYESKARSVVCNVDPNGYVGNMRLLKRLHEGEFKPHDIAFMEPGNMFPERWRHALDAKLQRDEYITNARPAAMTDQFRCGRCKKRECSYMELQTRSCDEPASIFVQCHCCGNRWRIG